MSIDAACALFLAFLTRNLPLQPVTVVISGSPFGLLAETFREGVVYSPFGCPILRWRAFPGTFAVLRPRFPSNPPGTRIPFVFELRSELPERTLSVFFNAGRTLFVRALRPDRTSSATCHQQLLLTATPSGLPFHPPFRFCSGNSFITTLRSPGEERVQLVG
jgi:hypothetical protein